MRSKTTDEIFYADFMEMMNYVRSMNMFNLQEFLNRNLPEQVIANCKYTNKEKVYIVGIQEEYYSRLNNTEAELYGYEKLKKRKYDHQNNPMRDKDNNFITVDVTVPHDCVAIVTSVRCGVKGGFKPSEHFEVVDYVQRTVNGVTEYKFIYVVPKKYCYRVNQTALVAMVNKPKRFYWCNELSLTNGRTIFLCIREHNPKKIVSSDSSIILGVKSSLDYTEELELIRDKWISEKLMFNPADCALDDFYKGRDNMAIVKYDGVLDDYVVYDLDNSLDKDTISEGFIEENV